MPWRTLKFLFIGSSRESASEIGLVQFFRIVWGFLFMWGFFNSVITYFSPRLTVIVVKKRVNARFFAQSGGALKNPPPGTVVDVEVTRPEW